MSTSRRGIRIAVVCLAAWQLSACPEQGSMNELFCTQLFVAPPDSGVGIKAAAPRETLWPHNAFLPVTITAKFLNGTPFQRQKVMQYAQVWSNISATHTDERGVARRKLRISFLPDSWANHLVDVRILFHEGGSASYVGSESRRVDANRPTMFFGWVDEQHAEQEIRQVVIHEWGHALGLVHEHQSPVARIPWDRDKVYDYYRRTQNPPWTRQDVDENVFRLYDASTTNYTAYDANSIMHYAIPSSLTIGGYSTPWNSELSPTDSSHFKRLYPYQACIINETENCCFDRQGRRVPCP